MKTIVIFDKEGKGYGKELISEENLQSRLDHLCNVELPGCKYFIEEGMWWTEHASVAGMWTDGSKILERTLVTLSAPRYRMWANPGINWILSSSGENMKQWTPRTMYYPGDLVIIDDHVYLCNNGGFTNDTPPVGAKAGHQHLYEIMPAVVWKCRKTKKPPKEKRIPKVIYKEGEAVAHPTDPAYEYIVEKPGYTNPNEIVFPKELGTLLLDVDAIPVTLDTDEEVTVAIGASTTRLKVRKTFMVYRPFPGQFAVWVDDVKYYSEKAIFTVDTPGVK